MSMKQITIRGIPPDVEKAIRKEAMEKKTSLNRAILSLLEKAVGKKGKGASKYTFNDLDHLCGSWAKDEGEEFNASLKSMREIDEDIWKPTD